jgi:type IV secretion system protein VirB4
VENVRRPLINTLNLADLMPVNTIWTGLNYAPCPMYPPEAPALMECVTHGATPFRLNLHVRDVGHTLVLGPTGSGKSVLLGLIAAQLRRYPQMSIFAFDKGMSMYGLCQAVGGRHFEIGGSAKGITGEDAESAAVGGDCLLEADLHGEVGDDGAVGNRHESELGRGCVTRES